MIFYHNLMEILEPLAVAGSSRFGVDRILKDLWNYVRTVVR